MNPRHPYPHSHPTPYPLQSGVPQQAGTPQPYPPPHQPQPWPHHPQAQFQQGWQAPPQHAGWPPAQPAPQAAQGLVNGVSSEERTNAMLAYLAMLMFPGIVPVVLYATANHRQFQKQAAAQAAVIQVTTLLSMPVASIVGVALMPLFMSSPGLAMIASFGGMFLSMMIWVFGLVTCVRGAIAANKGEAFHAPIVGRWLR